MSIRVRRGVCIVAHVRNQVAFCEKILEPEFDWHVPEIPDWDLGPVDVPGLAAARTGRAMRIFQLHAVGQRGMRWIPERHTHFAAAFDLHDGLRAMELQDLLKLTETPELVVLGEESFGEVPHPLRGSLPRGVPC